jgi:hypothetical protein
MIHLDAANIITIVAGDGTEFGALLTLPLKRCRAVERAGGFG